MSETLPNPAPDGEKQLPNRLAGNAGKTILVVDDAQFLGLGLQRALRNAGFEAVCVTSGMRALEALEQRKISVVLTDLQMPEMSGEELLGWLNHSHPGMPCVVMTGYGTRELVGRIARLPNVVGILVKPIEYNRLFATLQTALLRNEAAAESPEPSPTPIAETGDVAVVG